MNEEADMAMYIAFIGAGICTIIVVGILMFLDSIENLKREFRML